MPVLLLTAIGWRFGIELYRWPTPPRPVRLVLAVGAFCAVLLQYRTLNGVEAGSALLVVMVALKFLESRNQRDQLVLIMISYFLMFASLLSERGPLVAAYVVLLVWLTTVALIQIGRRGEFLPYRATGALSGRLLLHALPVMAALFVLFPRLPGPLWAIPGSTSSGATGLNDTMSPGDITNLGLSDEVAFRVEFDGQPPRANDLYWRGPSLTHFNGRTWSMLQGGRRGERVADTIEYRGEPTSYRVMLEPNGRNWAVRARHAGTLDGRQLAAHGQRLSARNVLRRPSTAPARLPRHVVRRLQRARAADRARARAVQRAYRRRAVRGRAPWRRAGSTMNRAAPRSSSARWLTCARSPFSTR